MTRSLRFLGRRRLGALALVGLGLAVPFAHLRGAPVGSVDEAAFLSENATAMNRMMAAMTVNPTGDVDRDFVAMMVPHHQGAIEMAQAVLRYGRNEQIRRLAQEIVVTQQQEIVAMRLAIGAPPSPQPAAARPEGDGLPHPHATETK